MQIKKITTINVMDDNNEVMEIGETYALDVNEGKCYIGVYNGLTQRGALKFESIVSGALVQFTVMSSVIKGIKKVFVQIENGDKKD